MTPFRPGDERLPGWGGDRTARQLLRERLDLVADGGREGAFPDDGILLSELEFGRRIVAAANVPADWEVVRVDRADRAVTRHTLGFDVAVWGGEHVSILCDSLVLPRWHAPPPESFALLRSWADGMTEHALFATADAAARFRAWYLAQPWAENAYSESELPVIRVDATQDAASAGA